MSGRKSGNDQLFLFTSGGCQDGGKSITSDQTRRPGNKEVVCLPGSARQITWVHNGQIGDEK